MENNNLTKLTGDCSKLSAPLLISDLYTKKYLVANSIPKEIHEAVHVGNHNQVYAYPEERHQEIKAIITACAVSYCGMNEKNTSAEVWNSCLKMVVNDFKFIGVNEIELAFRLCASGKISANIIAYSGRFNASILGEILNSYMKEVRFNANKEINEAMEKKKHDDEKANREMMEAQTYDTLKSQWNDPEFWMDKTVTNIYDYQSSYWYKNCMEPMTPEAKSELYKRVVAYEIERMKDLILGATNSEWLLKEHRQRLQVLKTASNEMKVKLSLAHIFMKFAVIENREKYFRK